MIEFLQNKSVLYADDDEIVLESTIYTLSTFFSTIYSAKNGEEAYQIYESKKPNVVILDIKMPKMNGLEVAKKIREVDNNTPILIVSSYTNTDDLLSAVSLNLVDYLVKPINLTELKNALKECGVAISKDFLKKVSNNIYYDYKNKTIVQNSTSAHLTKSESLVFELLLSNKGNLTTYEDIDSITYKNSLLSQSAIRNIIYRLRKKIGKNIITSIQDHGYILK